MFSRKNLYVFLWSLAGMAAGFFLVNHGGRFLPRAWAGSLNEYALSTNTLEVVDAEGNRIFVAGPTSAGTPALWFFDKQNRSRLNIGLYADGTPFVVLNDQNQAAVEILRLVGDNPYLIFKNGGRDRLIMALKGSGAEPSLTTVSSSGQKNIVFGEALP